MNTNHLNAFIAVTAMVLFTSVPVRAAETANVSHLSGEIAWIDLKVGKLDFKRDVSPSTGEITQYRITENETRVTNPSDKKFLTVSDLQPGQYVTLDVLDGKEEKIVQKITTDTRPAAEFKDAYGKVEVIDQQAGTLTLYGRPRIGEAPDSNMSYFVFDPKDIIVMQSPSNQPVQLELKQGDVIKVEYLVSDGNQRAHTITVYTPTVTRVTTTTTTTEQW